MTVKTFIRKALELQGKDLLENVQGLTAADLAWRPARHANSVGFLLWHMARVEDGWIQRPVQRRPHLWVADKWCDKFSMPEDQRDMGYNYTLEQLDAFKTPALELLLAYRQAVRAATMAFLDSWDPETDKREVRAAYGTITVTDVFHTLVWELNNHGGQVAYIRGLLRGLQRPDYMGPLSTG